MRISKKLAQEIVKEMMKVIPYNVNVMNEKGIIIGSGDHKRVGALHEGAVEAIRKKQMIEIYEKGKGSRHGVNEPILINGEVIGVVGITGEPEEIHPFSKLVRVTTILLIEQAKKLREYQQKEKQMEEFLYKLAYGKTAYNEEFYNLANSYGVDLNKNYQGVLLQGEKMELFEKKLKKMIPIGIYCLRLDSYRIVLFLKESKKNSSLIELIEDRDEIQEIGIGDFSRPFYNSLEKASFAIEIGKKLKSNQKVYKYEEWKFFIGLSHDNKNKQIQLIQNLDKIGDKLELVKTLQIYIEENREMNETSRRLNIHRNTLNYRLDKIYELTGKHPKNLLHLFELLVGLIWKS